VIQTNSVSGQTYEGGIAASPGSEAHGAYTFCALGCLCILGPPHETVPKYLNVETLYAWLSHRQDVPAAGFAGRANKLVDGCYSHWIGGCWSLLEAALLPNIMGDNASLPNLWDREGLLRYILCCAQNEQGGLRDKPSKSVFTRDVSLNRVIDVFTDVRMDITHVTTLLDSAGRRIITYGERKQEAWTWRLRCLHRSAGRWRRG
jgi:hypothetical protein